MRASTTLKPHPKSGRTSLSDGYVWDEIFRPGTLSQEGLAILPQRLQADIRKSGWTPDNAVLAMPADVFSNLTDELLLLADKSVQRFGPSSYHNGDHFRAVLKAVMAQILVCKPAVPDAIIQALHLAAVGHDMHHQGSTFRSQAPEHAKKLLIYPCVRDISTEMASATAVDEWAAGKGIPLGIRVLVAQLIDCTTFGVPGKEPITKWEKLLACADIAPEVDFYTWLESGLNVTYREVPSRPAPDTFESWVVNRLGFLDHIEANLTDEAKDLGWNVRVATSRNLLEKVESGDRSARGVRRRMESLWFAAQRHETPEKTAISLSVLSQNHPRGGSSEISPRS